MIKNFLYSFFVHFLLIFVIYFGLTNHKSGIVKSNEMAVSIAVLNHDVALHKNAAQNEAKINSNSESLSEQKTLSSEKSMPEDILTESKKELLSKHQEKKESLAKVASKKNEAKKEEALKKDKGDEVIKVVKKTDDLVDVKKIKTEELGRKQISEKKSENQNLQAGSQKLASFRSASSVSEGEDLSSIEKLNIQLQIKSCYKRSVQESRLDSKIKLFVKISISQEGFIETEIEDVVDLARYNDPSQKDYKIVIDNIRRSLELCSPLRNLPPQKYEIWKEIILQFDPVFNG